MSKANEVADAVKAAIDALALAGVTAVRRKFGSLPPGRDPKEIAVSVGEEGEFEYLTARLKIVKYPVGVTYFAGGGDKVADDTAVRNLRAQLWESLEAKGTYSGVTGFNAVHPSGKAPYDQAAAARDLNRSELLFVVEVIEAR